MAIDPQVHAWLDRWDRLREQGQQSSLDDFAAKVCGPASAELIDAFLHTVQVLSKVDAVLRSAGGGPA